jgi:hypothetical protein
MAQLMASYCVTTERALVRAIRDELIEETWEPGERCAWCEGSGSWLEAACPICRGAGTEPRPTLRDAELQLDGMLEATYQRLMAG